MNEAEASALGDAALRQAAEGLVAMSRSLHARGWVPATSGNFSVRLSGGDIAITASGSDKSRLGSGDILRLSPGGTPRDGGTPSAETGLHLQVYARDNSVGAVLHTHSINAVLAAGELSGHLEFTGLELLKAFPGISHHDDKLVIPVFDNDQDIAALATKVERHMDQEGTGHAYLIRGHGVYTWAESPAACLLRLEALEYLFEYHLRTQRRGTGANPGHE